MLSYRHAFHAGNYADVLKHIVLCQSLDYLIQKPAPILYIDTHAGAGQYALRSKKSKQTDEYKNGIGALDFSKLPESINSYKKIVQPAFSAGYYPGSPLLAAQMLREQDKLSLFEMHSTDCPLLKQLFEKDRRVRVNDSDGYHSLKALLPAKQARAVVLIDPSYEVKSDFDLVVEAIKNAHQRMATAVIMVWYPIVDRARVEKFIKSICNTGIRDIWRYELAMQEDSDGYGMTGSGMLVINPPWVLAKQMRECLPLLAEQMVSESGYFVVEELVGE
ncbi:MAG: 23S rRNA (adenine(2030)-N(6))-methyltransferase RlmJ [Gammaproteobacteria bacterium]|nr:23S rRNA (adenine(2030)-N(6))-methyltransferase RlmJ [Gammaproteobacteria bacterium]MCW9056527.1 23S rRNA (adenine(2030)-N(6))-methyltransferase RlmJ [Gammaproteobacteria bacterium]